MIQFDYYPSDIKLSSPLGRITIDQFYRAVRNPAPAVLSVLTRLRTETDPAVRAELKTHLYAFTPCVQITGRRRYSDITAFTGIAAIDFDKIVGADIFKDYLFDTYPFIMAAWLSSSGNGVRAFINIPVVQSVSDFKLYYNAIHDHFNQYIGFDRATQNPVLPLFLSYDPNIHIRTDYTTWTHTAVHAKPKPIQNYKFDIDRSDSVSKIIKSMVDKIHDNGHPQLRAASFCLGGYVGSGLIARGDAIQLIDYLIDTNSYLSIKPHVYKRTARQMIQSGSLMPLYL